MYSFPLDTVKIEFTEKDISRLNNAHLSLPSLKICENDFYMDVKNIAQFRVNNGNKITIKPYKNADDALVKLYLEGSALGVILHQRAVLPFHGTSFEFKDKGVLICGHSGSGKSSVSAAFCQNGAHLISDDISPVRIGMTNTALLPLKTRIKLWEDSLQNLQIARGGLDRIGLKYDKYYLPMTGKTTDQTLDHVIILSLHDDPHFTTKNLMGMDKFHALHGQIFRRGYLKGMPEIEKKYFTQLFLLADKIKVTKVFRPKNCDITATMNQIQEKILT